MVAARRGPWGPGAAAAMLASLASLVSPAEAAEPVDLELVLLADSSRSIDDVESRLQRQGYATAITDPSVLGAIANGYRRRIAVTYVEWADMGSQDVVVPWTIIDGPESAAAFARRLLEAPRRATGPNAIGSALTAARRLIESNDIEGERRVIDFSGDSVFTLDVVPTELARAEALAADIAINGLAVLCHDCSGRPAGGNLEAAFARLIIGGPGSFVITADRDASFAEAVRKKLLLEVAGGPGALALNQPSPEGKVER